MIYMYLFYLAIVYIIFRYRLHFILIITKLVKISYFPT